MQSGVPHTHGNPWVRLTTPRASTETSQPLTLPMYRYRVRRDDGVDARPADVATMGLSLCNGSRAHAGGQGRATRGHQPAAAADLCTRYGARPRPCTPLQTIALVLSGVAARRAAVACSVFSPHWLQPADWILPDVGNVIAAVLNSPTTLLECTDLHYERIFVLTVTQPAQMLATFGLLFVPCYWSDCVHHTCTCFCGGIHTNVASGGATCTRRQLQVHQEG